MFWFEDFCVCTRRIVVNSSFNRCRKVDNGMVTEW